MLHIYIPTLYVRICTYICMCVCGIKVCVCGIKVCARVCVCVGGIKVCARVCGIYHIAGNFRGTNFFMDFTVWLTYVKIKSAN